MRKSAIPLALLLVLACSAPGDSSTPAVPTGEAVPELRLEAWEQARAAKLQTLQMRLTQAQLELVEEALARFLPLAKDDGNSGPNIRGTAFYLLCKAYLEQERGLP